MAFPLLPFIGQIVTVIGPSGQVEGTLIGLSGNECVIQPLGQPSQTHPLIALKSGRFSFPTFEDAIKHLAEAGEARHCPSCYIALLYAVEFLSVPFSTQAFAARSDSIRRGIISFLAKDFPSAGYSLLPQADGIISQILHEDGLLRQTDSFPVWTKEHPVAKYHGKKCTNLVAAVEGATAAVGISRLKHVTEWLQEDRLEAIRQLRNKLLHGAMLDVSEHEAASIVVLLQAVHHGVTEHGA